MSGSVSKNMRDCVNGGARGREPHTPAVGGAPGSAGEVIRKIRKILDDAFKDPRRGYGHELKLLFYGEPNITWVPIREPPGLEKVRYYPYVVCVSIVPAGGRLRVEISGSVYFFETWKQAFDYVAEKVAELCNYSIVRAEIVYVTSDVIWRRD